VVGGSMGGVCYWEFDPSSSLQGVNAMPISFVSGRMCTSLAFSPGEGGLRGAQAGGGGSGVFAASFRGGVDQAGGSETARHSIFRVKSQATAPAVSAPPPPPPPPLPPPARALAESEGGESAVEGAAEGGGEGGGGGGDRGRAVFEPHQCGSLLGYVSRKVACRAAVINCPLAGGGNLSGKCLVAGGDESTKSVLIWDVDNGSVVNKLQSHP
jgi:hypothetical protein